MRIGMMALAGLSVAAVLFLYLAFRAVFRRDDVR
jgi:hypothetical protein